MKRPFKDFRTETLMIMRKAFQNEDTLSFHKDVREMYQELNGELNARNLEVLNECKSAKDVLGALEELTEGL